MASTITNPFRVYGYAGPEYFCDREEETRRLTSALLNGRNVTLVAPRRMGKTGLIQHTFHHVKATMPDAIVVYIDIFATRNQAELVKVLGQAVMEQMRSRSEKWMERVFTFFKSMRPSLSTDEFTGAPRVTLTVEPTRSEQSLSEIMQFIDNVQAPCFIAIDEFQQITNYPETTTEALLRSYVQFMNPGVHFVFSGSSSHLMSEMFLSAKRPFYQSTQMMSIGPIAEDAYREFAQRFFAARGGNITAEAFHEVYSRFEGHTWYVQAVLCRLYEHYITVDNAAQVDAVVAELVEENVPAYERVASLLTTGQLELLKAIARAGAVSRPTSGEFLKANNLPAASSVDTALKVLVARELVFRDVNRVCTVYDRLMAYWLRRL